MPTLLTAFPDVLRPDVDSVLVNCWYLATPEQQRLGADALVAEWNETPWPDGCLSRSCFLGTEGDTVLAYSQWSLDGRPGAVPPRVEGARADVDVLEPAQPIVYHLYRSVVPDGPRRTPGCIVIPTFDVDGPERQRRIVEVVAGPADERPAPVAGLIGAHFHVSIDGSRVFNYAEWTDEDAHRQMVESVSSPEVDDWRTRITSGTPGVRFTGWRRYSLLASLTP